MGSQSDTDTTDNNPPYFIKSSPIGEDQLEGKAHERIAKSIAQLIEKNETENKLIGLDGAWGSGKSNLIEILKSKFLEEHHFFIYDAWGHQEDLQRRSFLEELTEDLCSCKDKVIDKPAKWKKKLKNLLARKRETKTKTIPRLSNGLIITILIAVFMPFSQTMSEIARETWLKIIITSVPLGFGLLAYLFASLKDKRWLSFSDVYAVYKGEELRNKTHVTISEKEPSVKEFQNWMTDLSDALTTKKLVIVFDNMDRLPPDKVLELWSSIYTFFAEDVFEGIWIIVPFDRNHISAAFESKENKEKTSEEFLNKSFSIIYRAPPPVLSDWKEFFGLKFKEAFRESEQEELHYVRKVFGRLQKEITPRNIIAFINEIVSLRKISEQEIKLRYMAVFVLAKKEILSDPVDAIFILAKKKILSGPANATLDDKYLKSVMDIFAGDDDLPNHIASLVYQVPLERASQVMLTQEILSALNTPDSEKLAQLTNYPNFTYIFEQVVGPDDLNINNAVIALAKLEKQDSNIFPEDEIIKVLNDLCGKEIENIINSPSEQHFTEAHKLLLEKCSELKSRSLVKHLVERIADAEDFNGKMYYQTLSDMEDCLQENKPEIDMLAMILPIVQPPAIFVDYLNETQDDYRKFKLKCDKVELQNYIIEKIPNNLAGLSVLSVVSDDYKLASIVKYLEKEVAKDSLTVENVGHFYEFYRAFSKEKPIKALTPDRLGSLFPEAKEGSGSWFELSAMILANPESWDVNNVMETIEDTLDNADENIVKNTIDRIAERIEYYENYGTLLLNYLSQQTPTLKAVLKKITINSYGISRLQIVEILQNYNDIQSLLEVTHEDFLNRLNGWIEPAQKRIKSKNILEDLTDPVFFEHIVEVDCNLSNYLVKTMIAKLNSLTTDEWQDALRDTESFIYKVTHLFLDTDKLRPVPAKAVTVYKKLLIEMAKNEFDMSDDRWRTFYEKTNKSELITTAKNIRDIFINDILIDPDKFLFLKDLLLDYGELDEKSGEVVRRILTPIGENDDCLKFIVDNEQRFITIIEKAKDDASDFIDIVKQNLEASPDDEKLRRFAEAIGVQVEED